MKVLIFKALERLGASFWFIPFLMASGAVLLAYSAVAAEAPVTAWLARRWGWSFTGGAEGASAVLGTIAGSMITIAGVVFSMTLVALSLTSTQLGPRLLRTFMRDRTTQVVLGTFVAAFLYCLLVLRTVRRGDEVAFVPHLSVSLGVLLAVVSVVVLIYFIDHVSVSIRANEIVARVCAELLEGIDRLYPDTVDEATETIPRPQPDTAFLQAFERDAHPVPADGDGYLQFIDETALTTLAGEADVILRRECRPGDYVVAGRPLVLAWPADRVTESFVKAVNAAFALGNERTPGQDIEFGVNQLVEIAVRALSPGVNDPFTAITCVDRLGSALSRIARRDIPSSYRYDSADKLREIAPAVTFPAITDAAFNQIRQYSRTSAAVTIRLLETIAVIAESTHRPDDRAALLRHVEMIARGAREGLPEAQDREAAEVRCRAARALLGGTAPTWH